MTEIPSRSKCSSDAERLEAASAVLLTLAAATGLSVDRHAVHGLPPVELLEVTEQTVRIVCRTMVVDVELRVSSVSVGAGRRADGEFAPELMATLLQQLINGRDKSSAAA